MKKWLLAAGLALLLLFGYVAAGPYLTVRAIRGAVVEQDAAALARQVDFPALRDSLKAQLRQRLLDSVGINPQAGLLGEFGGMVAGGLVNATVETMVTPTGLGALMEGRKVWRRVGDGIARPDMADPSSARPPVEPLQGARYRYESSTRFTATVRDDNGRPIVFVMTRDGLRWRLSDIRLPP